MRQGIYEEVSKDKGEGRRGSERVEAQEDLRAGDGKSLECDRNYR